MSTVASTITREDMAESELNIDELYVDELKEELRKLNLQVSGSKAVLRERLRAAIRKAKTSTKEGKSKRGEENEEDDGENDEEICEHDSDSNSDSEEDDENDATTVNRRARTRLSLTFKDIKDSLQTFSGDSKKNVRKWMEEFEETCEVCRWTEAQKIIYAKKLLHSGSAKLFVSYKKCATSWKKLKKTD